MHTSERDLIANEQEELVAVWVDVFGRPENQNVQEQGDIVDLGLADRDIAEMRKQMGKWTKESTLSLMNAEFWRTMRTANTSRGSSDRLHRTPDSHHVSSS